MARYRRPNSVTEIQRQVGLHIRWARECVEPNRAAFARLMGVDRSTLHKIEDGSRPPSIFNVLEIAHRLRVTCDYILTGSLRGVDGELAALLVSQHPELAPNTGKAKAADTSPPPKTPAASAAPKRKPAARR
jgi:DNA-binding XRE family transcriptional regulator